MPTAYITCPREWVDELASSLVEERLAACVNVVKCRSTYRWEGDVIREKEAILFCKTTDDRYEDLVDRVQEIHPHEVPCIERFDPSAVVASFDEWVSDSVMTGAS